MPSYLHKRPRHIVQHCLEKVNLAKSIPSHHVICKVEGQFEVHSQTAMLDAWYNKVFTPKSKYSGRVGQIANNLK